MQTETELEEEVTLVILKFFHTPDYRDLNLMKRLLSRNGYGPYQNAQRKKIQPPVSLATT